MPTAQLVKAIIDGDRALATSLLESILAEKVSVSLESVKEEVGKDIMVSEGLKKFVKSTLLGNIRAASKGIKHDQLEKLHRDAGQDEAADRHARANRRLDKAWAKAQTK